MVGDVEYTDCISDEELDPIPTNECPAYDYNL